MQDIVKAAMVGASDGVYISISCRYPRIGILSVLDTVVHVPTTDQCWWRWRCCWWRTLNDEIITWRGIFSIYRMHWTRRKDDKNVDCVGGIAGIKEWILQ